MKLVDTIKESLVGRDVPVAEVEEAARWLWDEFRSRKGRENQMAAMEFQRGQKAEFIGKTSRGLARGAVGTVEKVNTKSVSMDFGYYGKWKVHATSLKPAPADAKVKLALV